MGLNNWILLFCLLEKVLVVLHRPAWLPSKSTYGIPDNWTYSSKLAMHVMNSYLVYWLLFPTVITSGILSSFHKNCLSVSFIGIDQCCWSGQFERGFVETKISHYRTEMKQDFHKQKTIPWPWQVSCSMLHAVLQEGAICQGFRE